MQLSQEEEGEGPAGRREHQGAGEVGENQGWGRGTGGFSSTGRPRSVWLPHSPFCFKKYPAEDENRRASPYELNRGPQILGLKREWESRGWLVGREASLGGVRW